MRLIGILGLIGLGVAGPAMGKAAPAAMPAPLRGIWMEDSGEGRQQCKAYLAEMRRPGGDAGSKLVGAEVITARGQHSYAEYGEGNFYTPQRVVALRKGKWRINARVGIDGPPEDGAAGTAVLTRALAGGKLDYKLNSMGGQPVDSWDEHRYFRCAPVPAGFYAG